MRGGNPKRKSRAEKSTRSYRIENRRMPGFPAAALDARGAGRRCAGAAAAGGAGSQQRLRLAGQEALALGALAGELAGAADGFRLLARLLFGGFLVVAAELHRAENPLTLHLLFQRLEGLVDIVVADENLHASSSQIAVIA